MYLLTTWEIVNIAVPALISLNFDAMLWYVYD